MTKKKRISVLLIMFAVVIGLGVLTFVLGLLTTFNLIDAVSSDICHNSS